MKNWEQTLTRALKRRWKLYRRKLKRCQQHFSEGSVHASRIEARRLAAQFDLLRLFASRQAVEESQRALKRHLDTFDHLRDAHVQLVLLKKAGTRIKGVKRVRQLILKRERRCQRKARRRVRRVKTRQIKGMVGTLVETLRERSKNPEWRRLDRRKIVRCVDAAFARVLECRRRMDAQHPATIHRTRVAFKGFRYMMESMQSLLLEITKPRLDAMKSFQELLGDLQDTEVFLLRIDRFIEKERIKEAEVTALRRWLVRRHLQQVNQCLRRADVIYKFWPVKSATMESG